jgi:hypothetical protein
MCVCVQCEKRPNFFQKSANDFTMRKSAKNLSVVVPQLSAVLLRVRPPSCFLHSSCNSKRLLVFYFNFKCYEGEPFFR